MRSEQTTNGAVPPCLHVFVSMNVPLVAFGRQMLVCTTAPQTLRLYVTQAASRDEGFDRPLVLATTSERAALGFNGG